LASRNAFAQDIEHYNLDDTKIALQGYSPVSYFEEGHAEKGKICRRFFICTQFARGYVLLGA
jgi:hypothetical protein